VTTPKFPPPPRRAQKRSSFSETLAVSTLLSAVTIWQDNKLSMDMPYLRSSQPTPPPRVSPPNTCLRHYPGWDCETEWVRFPVEIAKRRATLDAYGACGRVHMDGAHAREINDNAIVAKGTAADLVASASNCREQIVVAREVDGGDDVGDT
jgi:hypothetical protein